MSLCYMVIHILQFNWYDFCMMWFFIWTRKMLYQFIQFAFHLDYIGASLSMCETIQVLCFMAFEPVWQCVWHGNTLIWNMTMAWNGPGAGDMLVESVNCNTIDLGWSSLLDLHDCMPSWSISSTPTMKEEEITDVWACVVWCALIIK